MFVDINGVQYNMYAISSFKPVDKKLENSDGTYVDAYFICYITGTGYTLEQRFNSVEDRDARYDELRDQFEVKPVKE